MRFPSMLYVQPANAQTSLHKMRSLIRTFASRSNILWMLSYWLNSIYSIDIFSYTGPSRIFGSDGKQNTA